MQSESHVSGLRVVLVGAHGHGRAHLSNIQRLSARLCLRLVGVCDTRPLTEELRALVGAATVSSSLDDLLESTTPDITIICTPIHTHIDLALTAMRAGSHVLLEKPPAPSLSEYERLLDGMASMDRACQIGFQSQGSDAVPVARRLIEQDAVGEVRGIGGMGAWIRYASYYERAAWAGRRHLDGAPVVDGALTNPFAHAVAAALRVDGSEGAGEVTGVETDLYRAHSIDADDTSCVRLTTARGTTITIGVTLCAEEEHDPYLRIHGSRGRLTLWYKRDGLRLENDSVDVTTTHACTDLLENLVAHVRDPAVPLLVPPERVRGFMDVLEAIRTGPDPVPVPARYQRVDGAGSQLRRVIVGIDAAVDAAAERLALFRELGLPWAPETLSHRPSIQPGRPGAFPIR